MSLSHLLKSANSRLGLSILQNSSASSYRASRVMHRHHNTIGNKGSSSSSWLPSLLRVESCSDDALHKQSIRLIVLPLFASSMMVIHLSTLAYHHEVLPYYDKLFNPHIDGKPVYSAHEVEEARMLFGPRTSPPPGPITTFIYKILHRVNLFLDLFNKDSKSQLL